MSAGAEGWADEEDEAGGSSCAVLPSSVTLANLPFFAAEAADEGECGGVGVPGGRLLAAAARSFSSMSRAMAMMAFVDGSAVRGETRGETVDALPVANASGKPEDDKDDEEELFAIEERRTKTQVVRTETVAPTKHKENVSVG